MLKVDGIKSALKGVETPNLGKGVHISSITSGIDEYMPKGIKGMQKVSDNLGEVSTTLINAAGTGIVAPIFIKYNPLSKSDKDTRTYSAWRQPVSAVLAIVSQLGAIIPFNRAMNNGFNLGMLGDQYNTTAFQDDKFIERQVKKNNPNFTKEQIKTEVKRIKDAQSKELLESIQKNNTIKIQKYGKDGKFDIDKKVFDGAVNDSIDDLINSEIKEKSRLVNEKRINRIKRSDFYRTHNEQTLNYMKEIEEILKKDDITEIRKALKEKAKSLPKEQNELKLITEEILGLSQGTVADGDKKTVLDAMKAKVNKVKKFASEYGKKHSLAEVEKAVDESLKGRLAEVDSNITFFKELKAKIKSGANVADIQTLIENKAKSNETFAKKGINFIKNVAESAKNRAKGSTRCLKQIGGVGIGLLMLPITCSLLNIIYPVFMDKFFPELSNKKKSKTVQMNTAQGSEVKNAT